MEHSNIILSLAAALGLDPASVRSKAGGLGKAHRLSDEPTCRGLAELLAALLCTDPLNATGAADLPFAGAVLADDRIDPGHDAYQKLNSPLQEVLAALIEASASGSRPPRSVQRIFVQGSGSTLRACIEMDAPAFLPAGRLLFWFGYQLLPDLTCLRPALKTALRRTHEVDGAIIDVLADIFKAEVREAA